MDEKQLDKGHVTIYHSFKGYGFIRRDKGRDVFFFHDDMSEGQDELMPGDLVEFEVRKEPKGPRAYNITRVHTPPTSS